MDYRLFKELPALSMKKLLAIRSPADIKSMRLVDEFVDDHIMSAIAIINGVTFSMWWCGARTVGALTIGDSKQAKKTVFDSLQSKLAGDIADMFDLTDEDMRIALKEKRAQYNVILEHLRSLRKNATARKEMADLLKTSKVFDSNFNIL